MLYAAYGSNLHPVRLADRVSSAQLVGTGYLPHWSLCFHKRSRDDSGKCNILAGHDGVHFAIFEISAEDKLALDKIEGLGNGYSETSLNIPGFGDCASYTAQTTHIDDSLRPYDWYKELVLAGARFHGFPDDYLNEIESVQALRDLDAERRANQWKIVGLVKAGS